MNLRGIVSSIESENTAKVILYADQNVTPVLPKAKHVGVLAVGDMVLVAVIRDYTDAIIVGVIP